MDCQEEYLGLNASRHDPLAQAFPLYLGALRAGGPPEALFREQQTACGATTPARGGFAERLDAHRLVRHAQV